MIYKSSNILLNNFNIIIINKFIIYLNKNDNKDNK